MLKVSFQWKNSDKICLCSHWAAGIILPPVCVYERRVAAVAARFGQMAKSSEKALVKRFCKKNFTEFLLDLKKWSAFFLSSPLLGKVQKKQDFVNNQALTKRKFKAACRRVSTVGAL